MFDCLKKIMLCVSKLIDAFDACAVFENVLVMLLSVVCSLMWILHQIYSTCQFDELCTSLLYWEYCMWLSSTYCFPFNSVPVYFAATWTKHFCSSLYSTSGTLCWCFENCVFGIFMVVWMMLIFFYILFSCGYTAATKCLNIKFSVLCQ